MKEFIARPKYGIPVEKPINDIAISIPMSAAVTIDTDVPEVDIKVIIPINKRIILATNKIIDNTPLLNLTSLILYIYL
jgi:hypothetical protein